MEKYAVYFKYLLLVGFIAILLVSAVKVIDKSLEDRTAFLRWSEHAETLKQGQTVYGDEGGRYPNLPFMLMILIPFYALGPVGGSIAWLLVKYLLIIFIFWATIHVAQNNGPPLPYWALFLILFLSARVFVSDLTHGNVNIVIGALVVCALLCSFQRQDFLSGMSIGLAAVLKVTPALFIPYFVYKKKWTSVGGAIAGVVLFCWFIPGLVLGFELNHQLISEWYQQMIQPFISGAPVGYMQTQHMNQSLTGIFYRFFTDSVAIAQDIQDGTPLARINFLALDQHTVSVLVKLASIGIVFMLAYLCRTPGNKPKHIGNLGEFAVVFLAMLFLSERSWKHHYILLILSHSFLLYYLIAQKPYGWRKWVPLLSLIGAMLLHTFTSSMFFGNHGSDLLEAYGVFVFGAFLLFIACGTVLIALRVDDWPARPEVSTSQGRDHAWKTP